MGVNQACKRNLQDVSKQGLSRVHRRRYAGAVSCKVSINATTDTPVRTGAGAALTLFSSLFALLAFISSAAPKVSDERASTSNYRRTYPAQMLGQDRSTHTDCLDCTGH